MVNGKKKKIIVSLEDPNARNSLKQWLKLPESTPCPVPSCGWIETPSMKKRQHVGRRHNSPEASLKQWLKLPERTPCPVPSCGWIETPSMKKGQHVREAHNTKVRDIDPPERKKCRYCGTHGRESHINHCKGVRKDIESLPQRGPPADQPLSPFPQHSTIQIPTADCLGSPLAFPNLPQEQDSSQRRRTDRALCPHCGKKSNLSKCKCRDTIANVNTTNSQAPDNGSDQAGEQPTKRIKRTHTDQSTCPPYDGFGAADVSRDATTTKKKIPQSTYLLCIGIPAVEDIAKCDMLGIPVELSDHEILRNQTSSVIKRADLLELGKTVGPAFVSQPNDEPVIHQAVMATLLADKMDNVQAEFQNWDWLIRQLNEDKLYEYICTKKASRVLVWVSGNTSKWPLMPMTKFYEHMEGLSAECGNLAVFLSQTEAGWEERKIGDIGAFDKIAEDAPEVFSFRPKTCIGKGKCLLPSNMEKMVVKRSHSCGAGHVYVRPGNQRRDLRCHAEGRNSRPTRKKKNEDESYGWFHQEYIETLSTFGEFRVLLCRDGVVGAVRTKFKQKTDSNLTTAPIAAPIAVQPLSRQDFDWYSDDPEEQEHKLSELHAFAKYVRAELLKRHDATEHFGSLRVGVRMDIGVSELSSRGRFFMVEAARFPGAYLFTKQMLRSPYTEILEALVKAFVEEYG